MAYVMTAETLFLALIAVLVAGLLRSHAEILRRLDGPQRSPSEPGTFEMIGTPSARQGPVPAPEIRDERQDQENVAVSFEPNGSSTLVAFLSTGCSLCMEFWRAFQRAEALGLPAGLRVLIVTKAPDSESLSEVERLAPRQVPVIMSSGAWVAYEVAVAPSFVYVDGATGMIRGEGSARSWEQLLGLLRTALADAAYDEPDARGRRRRTETPAERDLRADRALAAAGIRPEDPEFYAAPYYGAEPGRKAD